VAQLGLFGAEADPDAVEPAEVADDVRALAARLPADLHLGGSTWSFPGWRGHVYAGAHDESTLARRGLAAYAQHPLLGTVGVDRTHYAPVDAGVFRGWADDVPARFRFLVKAQDVCTLSVLPNHPRHGARRGQSNPLFLDAAYARDAVIAPFVEGLGARAGVLLFQLAPQPIELLGGTPRRFAERLYRFLRDLPRGPRYAVEVRNAGLLGRDYAQALHHGGAVHCHNVLPEMPPLPVQAQIVGPQPALVVRWMLAAHHTYESASKAYEPFDELRDPAPRARAAVAALVADAVSRAVPSWVIVNNNAEGCSPASIVELARLLV
jgi:uncharacterized protein YecE (DUF72 family)